MAPYREGHGRGPSAEAYEDGLVEALIQQFPDPLTFYRELIQNSIDAGHFDDLRYGTSAEGLRRADDFSDIDCGSRTGAPPAGRVRPLARGGGGPRALP